MAAATFLDRSERSSRPRSTGLTHVLDKGLPFDHLPGLLDSAGDYIDIWKMGFGTAYVDHYVGEKVRLLQERDILACVGGTLLEAAWAQAKAEECLTWAKAMGFPSVEVSNGAIGIPRSEKSRLIAAAAVDFVVIAEVGSKDARAPVSARDWAAEMATDIEAGAKWGITEGRESGTVGLYAADGSIRWEVVESVVAEVGVDKVLFEAPRTSQQAALIHRFGPNVNLGNIAPMEVLGLEALRLGLRADTMGVGRAQAVGTAEPA